MMEFSKDMREKTAAATKEAAEKNSKEGEKFLAENKAKPGVKTTASGLQYKVEKEGSGTPPKETDTVVVNYRGTLIDGTEFDSSYKRGEPATFPVNRVIKGWTEALQLMKPGAKYQLVIPSDLAYGPGGTGGDIGPNATLIFEVELMSAKPGEASAPSPAAAAATSACSDSFTEAVAVEVGRPRLRGQQLPSTTSGLFPKAVLLRAAGTAASTEEAMGQSSMVVEAICISCGGTRVACNSFPARAAADTAATTRQLACVTEPSPIPGAGRRSKGLPDCRSARLA